MKIALHEIVITKQTNDENMATRIQRRRQDARVQTQFALEFASAATAQAMAEKADIPDIAILEEAVNTIELPESDPNLEYDLAIHDTETKIVHNRLGTASRQIIREAAPFSSIVEKFISDRARDTNDPEFPKKLRSFFFREYKRLLVDSGIVEDELFVMVNNAVSALIKSPTAKFAANAILVHLFIICDLFERPPTDVTP